MASEFHSEIEDDVHPIINATEDLADKANGQTSQAVTDVAMSTATSDLKLQGALQTIGNGVEELVTTVKDLLGASDSDSSGSDYSSDSKGAKRFSFRGLRKRVRKRRRRRLGEESDTSSTRSFSPHPEGIEGIREIIPEVRYCNFKQFKSRPSGHTHKLHCIDALLAGDELDKDMESFRDNLINVRNGAVTIWQPDQAEVSASDVSPHKWVRRIRINSSIVLEVLQHISHDIDELPHSPMVFDRPFQILVLCHENMKEQVANMRTLASDNVEREPLPTDFTLLPTAVGGIQNDDWNFHLRELCKDDNSFEELECFVKFMEDQIIPDSRRYDDPSSPQAEKVRFEDIWYLFKRGDIVHVTSDAMQRERLNKSPSTQSLFQIWGCQREFSALAWILSCAYLDYNGDSYGYRAFIPRIRHFLGEKKVVDMGIYPVSYLEDDKIMADAQSNGAKIVDLMDRRFGFYRGWTEISDPLGGPATNPSGDEERKPQYIEGVVLVDYRETFSALPNWKPTSFIENMEFRLNRKDLKLMYSSDSIPIIEWDKAGKISLKSGGDWSFTTGSNWMAANHDEDRFHLPANPKSPPTGKLLALLPKRFYAYSVLERQYIRLNIDLVHTAEREASEKAFEKLAIDKMHKRLIVALVKSHFDKIETEKRTNIEIETQDLIRGKGKGAIVLLHGVPGVGKTATAEAIAQKWKRPLFPITCGDLGYTADALESSLSNIFRIAHHWGCILLLDEADVFITRREVHDLKRNALVSGKHNVLITDMVLGTTCGLTFSQLF